ncbi:MAG: hypothetical protein ACK44W_07620 [Planctomycetota bacterium]
MAVLVKLARLSEIRRNLRPLLDQRFETPGRMKRRIEKTRHPVHAVRRQRVPLRPKLRPPQPQIRPPRVHFAPGVDERLVLLLEIDEPRALLELPQRPVRLLHLRPKRRERLLGKRFHRAAFELAQPPIRLFEIERHQRVHDPRRLRPVLVDEPHLHDEARADFLHVQPREKLPDRILLPPKLPLHIRQCLEHRLNE